MNDEQKLLLKIVGVSLFGGDLPSISENQIEMIIAESNKQAVFPLLFSVLDRQLQEKLTPEKYSVQSEEFLRYAIAGTRNFAEHEELHELMIRSGIPYVVIKGLASAMYYPEPSLRSMGDVDFLVGTKDIFAAGQLLESIGFSVEHGSKKDGIHVAYERPPMSVWELHRNVNGIPKGETGKKIQHEIDNTIRSAEIKIVDGTTCCFPDKLHHGLVLLLHTASHLTHEGVGLRHICDWVVFASSLGDYDFREIFERKLKSFGLWQFAQALTLLGVLYLGAPEREWAMEAFERGSANKTTLDGLMHDIISGGNFGTKDLNRYREIKYIANNGTGTVSADGILIQVIKSLNKKVHTNHKTISKHKILMPIGFIAEGGKYLGLLITGKRKSKGTKRMLNEASERKRIYSRLHLFEE